MIQVRGSSIARALSTMSCHQVLLASPIVLSMIVCAFGRVFCVGTIACMSASPCTSVYAHGSSIKFRSDCSPCKYLSVGGCGRNWAPVDGRIRRVSPAPRFSENSPGKFLWTGGASSCKKRSRAACPLCAVYQIFPIGVIIVRCSPRVSVFVVFPACLGTVIITV